MGTLKYFDPEQNDWVPVSVAGPPGEGAGSSYVTFIWDDGEGDYVQFGDQAMGDYTIRIFVGLVDPALTSHAPINILDEWKYADLGGA